MAWNLKWSTHVKALEARAKSTGAKPKPLIERPKIRFQDVPFSEAFFALSSARTNGYSSPNAIAISEIAAYCSLQGIASVEDRSKYLRLIQMLDSVYLEHWAKTHPTK